MKGNSLLLFGLKNGGNGIAFLAIEQPRKVQIMSLSYFIDSYGVVRVHGTGCILATHLLVHAQLMAMNGLLNRQHVFDLRDATLQITPSDIPMMSSRLNALRERHGQALTIFVVGDTATERIMHTYVAHRMHVGLCVTHDIEVVDEYLGSSNLAKLSKDLQALNVLQPQLVWPLVDILLPPFPDSPKQ